MDPVDEKNMLRHVLAIRILYMTAAILLGAAAGLSLVNQKNVGLAFFALYVLFFSLMICFFELGLSVFNLLFHVLHSLDIAYIGIHSGASSEFRLHVQYNSKICFPALRWLHEL